MDELTFNYYESNAEQVATLYESVPSALLVHLQEILTPGATVLDVGAGSGRDLAALLEHGYEAYGIEPSAAMRRLAIACHPILSGRMSDGYLPNIAISTRYDAVISWGSLMHVPISLLIPAMQNLSALLLPGGYLLISVPMDRPGLDNAYREASGRLYTPIDPTSLLDIAAFTGLDRAGFFNQHDELDRPDHDWATYFFRKPI